MLKWAKTKSAFKDQKNVKEAKTFSDLTTAKQVVIRKQYEARSKKVIKPKGDPPSKSKVIVPDQAKGAIPQKEKNLTAYGKAANAAEPDKVLKSAIKKDWTIITDNCYGVAYMKALNKPYESPFFSMFIFAPDYITLLENFNEYMSKTPIAQSPPGKTRFYNGRQRKYPVLILEGSKGPLEIHMAHEKQSPKEAIDKWEKRKARMNFDKKDMFVKMDSRDKFTVALGKRFLALKQFPHKKLFVAEKYRKSFHYRPNVIIMSKYKTMPPIGTLTEKLYPVPV